MSKQSGTFFLKRFGIGVFKRVRFSMKRIAIFNYKNNLMKTKQMILGTLSVAALSLLSCNRQVKTGPNVSYQIRTTSNTSALGQAISGGSGPSARGTGLQGGMINWSSGYASAKAIEFEAQGNNQIHFQSETAQKIDLFAPMTSLGGVTVAQGVYNQVEFQVQLQPTATEAAFYLQGTYNNVPVIFRVDAALDIDADLPSVTIAAGQSYNALTALNLSNLTQGVSAAAMDAATKDAQGNIVISTTANTALYDAMYANLKKIEDEQFQ